MPLICRAPRSSFPPTRRRKDHYLPLTALIMSHYREGKDTCLFAAYGTHHSPIRRSKDHHLPRTALIMSHMGVKIPSANTNTMTATIPIRMGSMRAVRLLRS